MVESLRSAVAEARRHGDLYFAALLSQDRIVQAFGEAISLWQGWIYTCERRDCGWKKRVGFASMGQVTYFPRR